MNFNPDIPKQVNPPAVDFEDVGGHTSDEEPETYFFFKLYEQEIPQASSNILDTSCMQGKFLTTSIEDQKKTSFKLRGKKAQK